MVHRFKRPAFAALALSACLGAAKADPLTAVSDLASLGAAPAAMGGWHSFGAFGAQGLMSQGVQGDFEHFSITHTHSIRHFPGKKKNLDQMDADPFSVVVPFNKGNSLAGMTFTLSGELGFDHRDTGGLLKKKHWLRGKARELFYAAVTDRLATAVSAGTVSAWESEGTGNAKTYRAFVPGAHVMGMGSGQWRWSFGLRRREVTEGKSKSAWLWNLGAAYQGKRRFMGVVSLLGENLRFKRAAAGVEKGTGPHLKWRAGYGSSWTYGLGARLGDFLLDYAVVKNVLPTISAQHWPSYKDAHLVTYGFQF